MESVPVTRRHWRRFFFNLTLVVLLAVSGLYAGLTLSTGRTIEAEITARARTIVGAITLTRSWVSSHQVYVEKRPGVLSGADEQHPDRLGTDGTVYTPRNPALVTRELSRLAEKEGAFRFRLVSREPLNPANAPDAFEAAALAQLEAGEPEVFDQLTEGDATVFRYVGPLRIDASCLGCHAGRRDQVGQVRGGLSVSFDVTESERGALRARWIAVGLFVFTTAALLAVLGGLVSALHGRLGAAEARIVEMAITDELTGLRNRRYIGQRLREELARSLRHGRRCACVLFDIDHFKQVNDEHGHAAGDAVLREVGAAAQGALRESDLLGRWGGEEFLAVLPETDLAGARIIADRLRLAIEATRTGFGGTSLAVTVSVGVADVLPGHDPDSRDIDSLVARADRALYRAKSAGRNRIELD